MKKILLIVLCLCSFVMTVHAAAWQMQQARQEYAKGEYTKVVKTLTEAINSSNYVDVDAYKLRASAYVKLNSPLSAINDLNIVIQEQPIAENYNQRGWANIKAGRYWDAYDDFTNTINIGKDKTGNYAEKGYRYLLNNKNIPTSVRVQAGIGLSDIGLQKYGEMSPQQMIPAFKYMKIVKDTNENDSFFKDKSKEEYLNDIKYPTNPSSNKGEQLVNELMQGYTTYILGDKILGKKLVVGAIKELRTLCPYDRDVQMLCNNFDKIMKAIEDPNF